jgi:hypothetical protein
MAQLTLGRKLAMRAIGIVVGLGAFGGWSLYKRWRVNASACAQLFRADEIERWSGQRIADSFGRVSDGECGYYTRSANRPPHNVPEDLVEVEISSTSYDSGLKIWPTGPTEPVARLSPPAAIYRGVGRHTEILVGVEGGVLRVTLGPDFHEDPSEAPLSAVIDAIAARRTSAASYLASR